MPFYTNYKYKPKVYRQPRKDKSITKSVVVLKERLIALYKQLAKDIELKNKRIA